MPASSPTTSAEDLNGAKVRVMMAGHVLHDDGSECTRCLWWFDLSLVASGLRPRLCTPGLPPRFAPDEEDN